MMLTWLHPSLASARRSAAISQDVPQHSLKHTSLLPLTCCSPQPFSHLVSDMLSSVCIYSFPQLGYNSVKVGVWLFHSLPDSHYPEECLRWESQEKYQVGCGGRGHEFCVWCFLSGMLGDSWRHMSLELVGEQ